MSARRKPGPTRIGPIMSARKRRWAYGVAAAALAVAGGYGLVTDESAALWLNLVGAVLFTVAVGNTPSRPSELEGDDDSEADG